MTVDPPAAYQEVTQIINADDQLSRARTAIKALDFNSCSSLGQWAAASDHPAAGPVLCTLLVKPRSMRSRRAWRKPAWVDLRVSAVRALRDKQDRFAAPTLANAMLADAPPVRAEASLALQALGNNAVLPIVDRIRTATDWPLDGMLCAIDTLGLLRDEAAGPTLARMLFGVLPCTPGRWLALHAKWSVGIGLISTVLLGACFAPSDGMFGILFDAAGLMMLVVLSIAWALPISFFISRGKTLEASKINVAAANALISIKDPRSVPSLIEVATEKYSQSARSGAIHALKEVLPVLNSGDYGLLANSVERRLSGMFAMHNQPLTLAIVRAIEHIGTGQSVGPIERLARRKPADGIGNEIRSEAERILPALIERKRLEEASSMLLRPSQGADNRSGQLLRPASSLAGYEEQVQLLRPGQAD